VSAAIPVTSTAAPIVSPAAPLSNPAAPIAVVALAPAPPRPDLDVKPTLKPVDGVAATLAEPPPAPARRPAWKRPVAIGAGILAVGLAGLAVQQSSAANRAYAQAGDQLTPSGAYKDVAAQARYGSLRSQGDHARTNATVAAGAAAACAVTAVIVGWKAWRAAPEPSAAIKIEF
jgi:hypothetical protein